MATTKIYKDYSEFLKREDKTENGVSAYFAENNANWEKENETNKACWSCSGCSDCSGCSGFNNKAPVSMQQTPVIANIHQAIFAAVTQPNALNMGDWHTCDTTHCRAGWVVVIAGEAGKEFEDRTSTLFAAMQIYKASSPIRVSPTRFFETNEIALKDMERCANEEIELAKTTA